MKNTITATTLMAGLLCACAASAQPPARATAVAVNSANQLAGVWRLLRYVDQPDGAQPIYAFGERPVGQFVFTKEGQFSIN